MRLIFLVILTMIAFAANSILNRMALVGDGTGPAAFALLRLGSGAIFLMIISQFNNGIAWRAPNRIWGAATLALYVIGFSFAYVTLDAGVGALILFGGVQLTMFLGALIARENIPVWRWVGSAVAFGGLLVLLSPTKGVVLEISGVILMAAAAVGWGVYSLLGRGVDNPLGSTAANFALALPVGAIVFFVLPDGITVRGAIFAIASGTITSGAGYALWYTVLPRLGVSVAAVSQLTVPLIAAAGGVLLLGEPVTVRFAMASLLVLGGVGISLKKN